MVKIAKDCPVNCPWLLMHTYGCGCELGIAIGSQITEKDGGEAKIDLTTITSFDMVKMR